MHETELKTPEQAYKAIHDLRERAGQNDVTMDELEKRIDDIEPSIRVLYERNQSEPSMDSSDRELVARYKARDDQGGKPLLRGFHDDDVWVPGLLDDLPCNRVQADLQRVIDDRCIVVSILHGLARHKGRPGPMDCTPKLDRRVKRLASALPTQLREAFERAWADSSGYGAEFIPNDMLPTVERDIKLEWEHRVPGLFAEVPAATPIQWGMLTNGWQVYLQGDVTGDDPAQIRSSSGSSSNVTVDFKTFAARAQVAEGAVEDSILPVMDAIIRPGLILAVTAGEEDAVINGDSAATHGDSGLTTWNPDSFWPAAPGGLSIDHRRGWTGLRHRAIDLSNSVDRSTFSIHTWIKDIANLDGPMARPEDTVGIFSKLGLAVNVFGDTTSILTAGVRTIDQYAGSGVPLVPGEIARVAGIPILVSQFMTADLNAEGIYDGTTTTYTGALAVRRNRFKRIVRRGLRLEVDKDITRGIYNLVVTTRRNFVAVGPSTEKNVRYGIKMAKS